MTQPLDDAVTIVGARVLTASELPPHTPPSSTFPLDSFPPFASAELRHWAPAGTMRGSLSASATRAHWAGYEAPHEKECEWPFLVVPEETSEPYGNRRIVDFSSDEDRTLLGFGALPAKADDELLEQVEGVLNRMGVQDDDMVSHNKCSSCRTMLTPCSVLEVSTMAPSKGSCPILALPSSSPRYCFQSWTSQLLWSCRLFHRRRRVLVTTARTRKWIPSPVTSTTSLKKAVSICPVIYPVVPPPLLLPPSCYARRTWLLPDRKRQGNSH